MFEVVAPASTLAIECFLYYGWNANAVPSVTRLPPEEFLHNQLMKVLNILLQVLTIGVAAHVVRKTTKVNFLLVMFREIQRFLPMLLVVVNSATLWCYTFFMPIYGLGGAPFAPRWAPIPLLRRCVANLHRSVTPL